jgi:isopenicillin N synthase-like dioxygenase
MSSDFPVIDLEPLRQPEVSAAMRLDVARQVARACEETGFVTVTGHGVPRAVIAELVAQSYAFFDLPLAEKLAVRRPRPEQNRGYIAPGEERLARLRGDETPPDLKELYTIGPFDGMYGREGLGRVVFLPWMWGANPCSAANWIGTERPSGWESGVAALA